MTNRREWLVTAGLAALSSCGRNKGKGFNGYGLVANAGDNSLAAIDLTSFRLSRALDLGASPSQVIAASDQAASRAYALTPANGTIHLIDDSLKILKRRRVADLAGKLTLADRGRALYAVDPPQRQLLRIDPETLAVRAQHKLVAIPGSLDFSNGYMAAASDAGTLELVHLETGQRRQTESPGLGEIRFRLDGKVLLAANLTNRSLIAFDVPTLRVVAELPLAMRPDHLCFNADQGQLFISGAGMDGVAVIFPFNILEVDQTLLAGRAPGPMACSASPAYLFVGSESATSICILNIATRKPVAFVNLGGRPSFIAVTPDSEYALVLDRGSNAMGVIHVPAIRANRLKTGAALYTLIGVGSRPVSLAIISRA